MPRIRTIKPEFWTSEQVLNCSPFARLLFIGIWNFCDDAGRFSARPRELKAKIFPEDDVNVQGLLTELSVNGLVDFYENGEIYGVVTGWERNQVINRPQPPRYPEPPTNSNGYNPFTEHSVSIHGPFTGERKGKEGKEGKGKERSLSPASCEARDAHPTKGVRECPEDFQPDLTTLQTLYAEGFSERDVYDAVASMKDWSRGGGKRKTSSQIVGLGCAT